jgi:hypothetical protein
MSVEQLNNDNSQISAIAVKQLNHDNNIYLLTVYEGIASLLSLRLGQ